MRKVRALLAGLWLTSLLATPVAAHPAQFTTLQVRVEASGRFQANLNIDILSFALGKTSVASSNEELEAALDGPRAELGRQLADAGERFRREVVIRTDAGEAAPDAWQLPGLAEVDAVLARGLHPRILMPGDITFSGTLPANAQRLSIRLPYVLGDTVHIYELPNGRSYDEPVAPGDYSTETALELAPPQTTTVLVDLGRYMVVGFKHILPGGLDHILFVLGLILLSTRVGALLWQVSAFTLAHAITLGLSIYGVIRLPPSITEPLIAASIVCIAVENLFESKMQPWRPLVVFCFGLIHGLGFASAFAGAGLRQDRFLLAIFGLNVGVECGQLAILAAVYPTLRLLQNSPRYRLAVVYPCSLAIAAIALFWTVQRVFWMR